MGGESELLENEWPDGISASHFMAGKALLLYEALGTGWEPDAISRVPAGHPVSLTNHSGHPRRASRLGGRASAGLRRGIGADDRAKLMERFDASDSLPPEPVVSVRL